MQNRIVLILLLTLPTLLFSANLKGQNTRVIGIDEYRFYVKIHKDAKIDLEQGEVRSFSKTRTVSEELMKKLNRHSFKQIVQLSKEERSLFRRGEKLRNGRNSFDKSTFSGLLELTEAATIPVDSLLHLADEFEAYEIVEYCDVSPLHNPTPDATVATNRMSKEVEREFRAPDFTKDQFYNYGEQDGDIIGIYVDYAWEMGITGQGVSFADIEWGWDYEHEEFVNQNCFEVIPTLNHDYDKHGTACLGEMYAADDGSGVKGGVYGADAFYGYSEITEAGRTGAILAAMDSLEAGDVIVYEMQAAGQYSNHYCPADFKKPVWDVTKQVSDAGIIVVAAAGNGKQNLDWPFYEEYMARGDNGSIIVGAAERVGRKKASFTTFGSRVNLIGYGDWSIYTTGYGDLLNEGPHADYTKTFSGTSSSTPIVASAVIAVQSFSKKHIGKTLTPIEMRDLLIETGTPSGEGWTKNTPLPNVKAAIEKLIEDHGMSAEEIKSVGTGNQRVVKGSLQGSKLSIQSNLKSSATVKVFDLLGREILSSKVDLNKGTNSINLIHSLAKGTFILSTTTAEGTFTQKLCNF